MHDAPRERQGVRRRTPGGFTLAEVMVAIAIFAVISAIAMTLYQQLQKTFKRGENASAQQQNTRIAFDRLIADLRMAGLNYNPDGNGARPDEQIEGMWQNAVTVRADYDRETSDANTPETTLGGVGMTFNIVSIGNDEIVTYALGKSSGAGGTSLQFQADVTAVPRDGTVDTITLNNVYVDMNSPPYTLYRMILKPGGTPLGTIVDRQPVADNIRSLELTYYDGGGNVLTTMAGGMDDPNSVALRKKIAKIGIRITGMTQDPDLAYFDPGDANPLSRNYRKFELASDVTPRNLGFVGVPDLDLVKPSTPTGLSVCAGHCGGLWTTWNANPPNESVYKYIVTYGASVGSQGNPADAFATSLYLSGLSTSGNYVVAVRAADSAGNESDPWAYSPSTAMSNSTVPLGPTGLSGTSIGAGNAVPNQIEVAWSRPSGNDPNTQLACDGAPNTPLRDLKGYRLYRGATSTFDPNVPTQVQAQWDPNSLPGTDPDPNIADLSVVNCRTYHYKSKAEDLCGLTSAGIAAGSGSAETSIPPAAPALLVATDMGNKTALLTWNPVTQDTSATPASILIDSYKVYRTLIPAASDPNLASFSLIYDGAMGSIASPSYTDLNMPNIGPTEALWYKVSARDDCPNESAASIPSLVTKCNFNGTIFVSMSPGGNPIAGLQTITATINGAAVPGSAQIFIRDAGNGTTVLNQTTTTYPFTFVWPAAQAPTLPGRSYDVAVSVTNSAGCTETVTNTVSVSSTIACCIAAANPRITQNTTLGSVSGGTKNNEVGFDIINSCGDDVTIEGINIGWNDVTTSGAELTGWTYTGAPSVVLSPAATSVARFDLRVSPFSPYLLPTSANLTTPLPVSYVFTGAMVAKLRGVDVGNTINTEYNFTVAGTVGVGKCTITVIADPTTPGITLCDPTVDPNCPGF